MNTPDQIGYIGRIPVRNLWLLMFYASDLFRQRGNARIEVEESPDDIPGLVAEILTRCVENRLRKNLTFGYKTRDLVLGRVRGRIDLLHTERRQWLARGRVACRFADLTVDTPRNRLVKAALERMARLVHRTSLAHQCRTLAKTLNQLGVTGSISSRQKASMERFGRHDAHDQQMVAAARLAFQLALPTEMAGTQKLFAPDRDIAWVRKLYEKGIAGFYSTVLPMAGWKVQAGKTLHWPIERKTAGMDRILPSMIADIVLDHAATGRRIIVDTKFNEVVVPGRYRDATLRSRYLYQIYAYVRAQAGANDPRAAHVSGMLLHPSVGETVTEAVIIEGHEIRFATIDLAAKAREIHTQLQHIVNPWDPASAPSGTRGPWASCVHNL